MPSAHSMGLAKKVIGVTDKGPSLVEEGILMRGGQPKKPADYDYLQAQGIKTFINLKTYSGKKIAELNTEKAAVAARGMQFIHIPMDDWKTPPKQAVEKIEAVLAELRTVGQGGQASFPLPAYVHCQAGRNRTGFFVFMYRVEVQGWSPKMAKADMFKSGFVKKRYKLFGSKNKLLKYLEKRYKFK